MMRNRMLFAIAAALLALLTGLQLLSLWRAPAAWMPASISVRLAAGESITLGRHELAAPQAERDHIALRRDAGGKWMLRQLSLGAPAILLVDGDERRMGSAVLQGGQRLQIGAAAFDISAAGAGFATFRRGAEEWRYDGATLYRDGRAQDACADAGLAARALALWNYAAPQVLTVSRALSFGGNVHCGNRLGVPGAAPGAAVLARATGAAAGHLVLSTGADDAHTALRLSGAAGQADLRQEERALAGVAGLVLGRTRLQLSAQGDSLTLTPARRVSLFSTPDTRLPPQVSWQWQQRRLWQAAPGSGAPSAAWLGLPLAIALAALALAATARSAFNWTGIKAAAHASASKAALRVNAARDGASRSGSQSWASKAALAPAGRYLSTGAGIESWASKAALPAARRHVSSWAGSDAWAGRAALLAAAALLAGGIAALMLQRAGHAPGAAWSLLLAATAMSLWLAMPGRAALPLPAAAALVLMATGLLLQLELGLGASESSWLRYYQKSSALLAIGSGLAGLWHGWSSGRRAVTPQRSIEWSLALLAAIALAALAAQVLWGDETGVFDLQPVELAKLALTALTAHCLALRMGWQNGSGAAAGAIAGADAGAGAGASEGASASAGSGAAQGEDRSARRARDRAPHGAGHGTRWLQLIAPALLFVALLGLALIQVDDYSPLILLAVWAMAMAFAYAVAARNAALAAVLAGVVLAAVAGIALVRAAGGEGMAHWPLAGSFYGDRFQVWLAPAEHPHTGQQLLQGARAIAGGGWWGADQLLGLRSLGQAAGAAIDIPAVQDDFAPSFFLNRHGLLGALLLWTAQAAFVIGLLHVAARAHAAAAAARDFRQAWLGRFRYFALCGGAAFVLGHLLLSWGTNLAIFPIMGQPMSFLSAGGSHLLFFLCPLLAFCAISAQSLEENESCRSMSSTKS